MRHFAFCLLLWMGIAGLSHGQWLSETLIDHRIEYSATASQNYLPVGILVSLKSGEGNAQTKREFLAAVARRKLRAAKISSEIVPQSFLITLKKALRAKGKLEVLPTSSLSPERLLGDKILVEASIRRSSKTFFSLHCRISFLQFHKVSEKSQLFLPKRVWTKKVSRGELSQREVFEQLTRFLRRSMDQIVGVYPSLNMKRAKGIVIADKKGWEDPSLERLQTYPGSKRIWIRFRQLPKFAKESPLIGPPKFAAKAKPLPPKSMYLGLGAGKPALVNALATLWKQKGIPLQTGLSGMFFSRKTRGIEWDAGWVFDRVGKFQQSVGISLAALNETSTEEREVFRGTRHLRTEVDTIDRLKFYLGPSYKVKWQKFLLHAGIVFRPVRGKGSKPQLLFQLGYIPVGFF